MKSKQNQSVESYTQNPVKPFSLILFVELWERYGFYAMQYLLIFFMIKELKYSDTLADNTFAAFTALAYAFMVFGGYIGDKILGNKRTMVFGALVLASGYLWFSINPVQNMFWALGLIIAGNAMFKANPSTLVAMLYAKDDPRVDGAYTLYYMAINIGSLIGSFLSPVIAAKYGWQAAFFVSFLGLVLAVFSYIVFHRLLSEIHSPAGKEKLKLSALAKTIVLTIILTIASAYLLRYLTITHIILYVAIILAIVFMLYTLFNLEEDEKGRFLVCIILICESIIFYALYQQRATSMNLFVIRNTVHSVFGVSLNPLQFQSFNPFWILLTSPILAWWFTRSAKKGKDLSLPTKFAFGMLLSSLGFLLLKVSSIFALSSGKVAGEWVFIAVGLLSLGEIFIGGIGLSMIARLVPKRIMRAMMGVWFMATAAAMIIGGFVATYASIPEDITNPVQTLPISYTA